MTLALSDESFEVAKVVLTEEFADPLWVRWAGVHLSSPTVGELQMWSGDFFEALRQVRRELDLAGVLVQVNGARVDPWPSGLQSSMYLASGLYLFAPGSQEGQVRLLDPAELSQVGTVAEQDDYRDRRVGQP